MEPPNDSISQVAESEKISLSQKIQMKLGMDFSVFKESNTWKAFGIGIILFALIGYAGLSVFGLTSDSYGHCSGTIENNRISHFFCMEDVYNIIHMYRQ